MHPGEIRTRPPGYLLDIPTSDLDTEEFTHLTATARTKADAGDLTEAAAILRQGLALWRGPALADVDSELVQRAAAKFEDARLSAIEERIRLDLALGRHQSLNGELATLVDEHPLRERLAEFRMLALYRSGRQADALEVGRRTRAVLVEELGVDPGPDLQKLEAAILNRDPMLDLRTTVVVEPPAHELVPERQPAPAPLSSPRQLPGSIADFIGREDNIEEIKQLLSGDPTDSYALRIVSISGRGGVGKSSLAIRVAHELASAFPDGVLFGNLQNPGEGDPTSELLARFLRALGVNGPSIPEGLYERAQLYRSKVAGRRLLVVLDDVTNEEQALPLLPGDPSCAVITTSRMRLSGLSGAHWVDVDEFDTDGAMDLLVKIIGPARVRAEEDAAAELVRLCGGLPLALRIVGARLSSRPHWQIASLVRRLLDQARGLDEFSFRGVGLRLNIDQTYRGMNAAAQRLFRLFTVVRAAEFPEWTAAALLDMDPIDATDVLESLVDVRLLDTIEYPGERVRYRFHSLVRIYANEQLMEVESEAERTAALTRVLGGWLALAEDTHRKEYGGDYTILHGDAPRWRPPDDGYGVPERNPMDWWAAERGSLVAAVRQAASVGMDELCWDLSLTLVTFFEARGYFDDWRESAQLGLAVCESTGNRTGTAAMLYSLGTMHMYQKRLPEAEQQFQLATKMFEVDGNVHGLALVRRNLALIDGLSGKSRAMLAKYQDALSMMRQVGDRMGEAHILRSVANYWAQEGDHETARTMLEESLAICQEVECLRGEAQVLHRMAYLHLKTGEVELASLEFNQVLLIVRAIGDRIGHVYGLYGLGVVRWREGQLDGAESAFELALSAAKEIRERLIEGQALCALGGIRLARGDAGTGIAQLEEAGRLFAELGSSLLHAKTLILLSRVHSENGDRPAAARLLEQARQLLSCLDSPEATRLLAQLDGMTSPLPSGEIASLSLVYD
ncbi:BTAD domain-containing putative transcriptional regulator [Actinophytocola sp.]|uniref:AfsR/SARP family transcriptional regulator n=1 Tax=Actinophytocola sp. TaxID=1872138 RepID=UPI00389A0715